MGSSWELTGIPFLPSTHFLRNCPPTAAVPFQGSCSTSAAHSTMKLTPKFTNNSNPLPSSLVKPSLTNPPGGQSLPQAPRLSSAHSQLSNQAQGKPTGALMFLFSSWPNPCVLTTQGAGWRSRTQHTNQSLVTPEPEFSPRPCSGHRGSATSLQRLSSIQKAPAKSIPTPDKLFSILASTFHPSGMKKSSQLSPRFPAEPRGRGDVGSRDLSPSAGPQHTLSLSAAHTKIPRGWRSGIWERSGVCSAGQGMGQPVPKPCPGAPTGKGRIGKAGAHGGSHPNCSLLNLPPLSQRLQSWEF